MSNKIFPDAKPQRSSRCSEGSIHFRAESSKAGCEHEEHSVVHSLNSDVGVARSEVPRNHRSSAPSVNRVSHRGSVGSAIIVNPEATRQHRPRDFRKGSKRASLAELPFATKNDRRITIHQRRQSIDRYLKNATAGITKQISVIKLKGGEYDLVDTGEKVASGCLAKDTGDVLVAIMLGDSPAEKVDGIIMRGVTLLLFPPLVAGVIYGLIPLKCPGLGVIESGFFAVSFIPPGVAAPGLGFLMLHALGVVRHSQANLSLFVFTCVLAAFFTLAMLGIGTLWMFPIPFGFIVCAAPSFIFATGALFWIIFGKNINKNLIKALLPLIAVTLLPIFFSATFGFYRTLFSQVNILYQAILSPFWVAIKITFKTVATRLVDMGNNPDAAPYLMFCFDAVAAMAGNFLFLSTNGVSIVFVMVALDVLENMAIALRVVFLVLKSRVIAPDSEDTRESRETIVNNKGEIEAVQAVEESPLLWYAERMLFRVFDYLEPAKYTSVPVALMDDDDRRGLQNIYLARAARLLLQFTASESSEMVTSCWAIIMIPFFYYGPNKNHMYTIDAFDDEAYWNAIVYSLTDFALELFTFFGLVTLFHKYLHIKVYGVIIKYILKKNLFMAILTISCTITIASFTFFLKHFGMDPSFTWSEYLPASNSTEISSCDN